MLCQGDTQMSKGLVVFSEPTCIGCGACTSVSQNWELVDKGDYFKAHPKVLTIDEGAWKENKEAEDICPVDAILIEEKNDA